MNIIYSYFESITGQKGFCLGHLNNLKANDLFVYRQAERDLGDYDIYLLSKLGDWRLLLIVYMYVLTNKKRNFIHVLVNALENRSFIGPQLVVGISLLGKKDMRRYLSEFRKRGDLESKSLGALDFILGHSREKISSTININQYNIGYDVAKFHKRFWIENGGFSGE